MTETTDTRNYLREVTVMFGVIPQDVSIKTLLTLKFPDRETYEEFENNVAMALNNHPSNGFARRYLECLIEAQYLQQWGKSIDTRQFLFTFNQDFLGYLGRDNNPKHRRRTDSPVSRPILRRKAGDCAVSQMEQDVTHGGGIMVHCRICGTWDGGDCLLTEELIAQKLGKEAIAREAMGSRYHFAVEEGRKLVRALIREELAKPASSNWALLFYAFLGGAVGEFFIRYYHLY